MRTRAPDCRSARQVGVVGSCASRVVVVRRSVLGVRSPESAARRMGVRDRLVAELCEASILVSDPSTTQKEERGRRRTAGVVVEVGDVDRDEA